ncbi:SMI1/KNR4 family protein, partial [Anaeromyxobacter sp. PSR-1]|uniref:SMI1/KNR4 family protein n=1 Tax=Anaeromyxobacter sp. PSR-1 TaxID=1300915 RepID=UPI000AFF9669
MAYPAAESLIREAETRLGRSLPVALRNRLIKNNGGSVRTADDDWELFPVWDPTDRGTMRKTACHM